MLLGLALTLGSSPPPPQVVQHSAALINKRAERKESNTGSTGPSFKLRDQSFTLQSKIAQQYHYVSIKS